eukprot:g12172.t1
MRLRVKMEAEQIVRAHREAERRKTDAEGVQQAHLDQIKFQIDSSGGASITFASAPPASFPPGGGKVPIASAIKAGCLASNFSHRSLLGGPRGSGNSTVMVRFMHICVSAFSSSDGINATVPVQLCFLF